MSLVLLVFVLGLKHGLDPDHLVAIDGFTRSSRSRWCGAFFSLGHGAVVTAAAAAIAIAAAEWQAPAWLEVTGAWISIGVLLALGVANLAAFWRTPRGQSVGPVGVKGGWLPERLAQASHPAVIAGVGAAFALSFDTISHALFFSLTGGWVFALLLGMVFTLGMVLTDALNGLFVARLVAGAQASRVMSLAISLLCLSLAAFGCAKFLLPDLAEGVSLALSAGSLALVAATYLLARRLRGGVPVIG